MNSQSVFRVLTLDGGGMRGLYSASLLYSLIKRFSNSKVQEYDFGKAFDLICGTSTGAILACGLATGISLKNIQDLYVKTGKLIFNNSLPSKRLSCWILKHINHPAANQEELKKALTNCFGNKTLEEIYVERQIALCIPSINANNFKPWVFKTPHIPGKIRDNGYTLVDVCLASAAAPFFFPLASQVDPNNPLNKQYFVDGGLWANNPILTGLVEALEIIKGNNDIPIEVYSVGTCSKPSGDPKIVQDPNWGIKKWLSGMNIMEMSLSSQAFGYTFMAQFLASSLSKRGIPVKIIRLEETNKSPQQYSAIGLDKADQTAIDTLVSLASQDADNIHSKCMMDNDPTYTSVKELFTNIPVAIKEQPAERLQSQYILSEDL